MGRHAHTAGSVITACRAAVYDVTRRETFDSLGEIWMQEVDMYSTIENAIKMVVANKVDRVRFFFATDVTPYAHSSYSILP